MENSEFLEQIQRYTVRIGKREDKELYGSGTLFFISKRKRACVLTAAHIVYSLIGKIQKKVFENDGVMLEPEVIFTGRNGD